MTDLNTNNQAIHLANGNSKEAALFIMQNQEEESSSLESSIRFSNTQGLTGISQAPSLAIKPANQML
jgi:hypothetical protein